MKLKTRKIISLVFIMALAGAMLSCGIKEKEADTQSIGSNAETAEEKPVIIDVEKPEKESTASADESAPATESAPPPEAAPAAESAPPTEAAPAAESAPPTEAAPAAESAPPTETAPAAENGQKTPVPEVDLSDIPVGLDPDDRINYIRKLYYDFTGHPESYESAVTGNITGYWEKANGELRAVIIKNEDFDGTSLSAEYYYAETNGVYMLYFVFAHNADYSVEYRIYQWDNEVIRYIGPYESEKTTYNYEPPLTELTELERMDRVLPKLIMRGYQELHLYGYI